MSDLSVIIPAYNAADFIGYSLSTLHHYLESLNLDFEILVVDDGSSDNTAAVVTSLNLSHLRLIALAQNQGKFGAIIQGMLEARGAVCIFTDADLPYELSSIGAIYRLIRMRHFHLVIGDRNLESSVYRSELSIVRYAATIIFSVFIRTIVTGGLFDTQCGLKGFRGDVAKAIFPLLRERGFVGDVEMLWIALKNNLEIKRIPVRLERTGPSTVNVIKHGISMLARIAKLRVNWKRGAYDSAKLSQIVLEDYDVTGASAAFKDGSPD